MKTEEEKYELIDQFLKGELSANHDFLNLLANDDSLKEQVNIQRLLKDAVIDFELLNVKAELQSFHKDKISGNNKGKWIAGAVVTLIGGAAIFYFLSNPLIEDKTPKSKKSINLPLKSSQKIGQPVAPSNMAMNEPEILSSPKQTFKFSKIESKSIPEKNVEPELKVEEEVPSFAKPDTVSKVITKPSVEVKPQEKAIVPQKQLSVKTEAKTEVSHEEESKPEEKPKHEIKNYVFEPEHETWEVPVDVEKSGKFSIFDRSGKMMYKRQFNSMEKLIWTGSSSDGVTLPPSVYIFMIEYADGTSHQGTITLSY